MAEGPPIRVYTLYVDEENPEVRSDQPWAVRDSQSADWALKRLGRLKAEKEDIDAQFKKAVEVLQARKNSILGRIQSGIDFFTANLVAFTENNKRQLTDGKTRSRAFLHGRLGFRSSPGRVRVVDESIVIEWAKKQPLDLDLLRYKAEINKDKLNEFVKREGIIPDGCEYEEPRDTVRVECEPIYDDWSAVALPAVTSNLSAPSLRSPGPGPDERPALQGPGQGTGGDPTSHS